MFAAAATRPESLSVIDPCNRTGKITIPMALVTETKGVSDFLKFSPANPPPPDAKDLSLCLLFQKGRCNAGGRCNQVHADPDYIADVRGRALSGRTCCARHGDVHSAALDEPRTVAVHAEREITYYALADFALTPSLELAISRSRTATVRVQANRVCRLHSKGSCKFGRDCKNIHLCSAAKPSPAPAGGKASAASNRQYAPRDAHRPAAAPRGGDAPVHPLGFAFRAVDINDRCGAHDESAGSSAFVPASCNRSASEGSSMHESVFGCDSTFATNTAAGAYHHGGVRPMSILSIMSEFNSVSHHHRGGDDELDPLEIMDNASNDSSSVAGDFNAFVDALVQCGDAEPMASPQWLSA